MNIWVLYMNDGTLGYAQFPNVPSGVVPITDLAGSSEAANTDGVVITYDAFGTTGSAGAPYNLGRTTTHEIGHWLGLRHPNGDASCGNDYCSDTPQQSSLSSACPATPGTVVSAGCGASSPSPPGKMYQNYMDYSDDKCAVMFTAAQKARVQACMANCVNRKTLTTSTACDPVGIHEYENDLNMSVYPNPTNGELLITINSLIANDFSIIITNPLGQVVREIHQSQTNSSDIKLNLANEYLGIYFITLKSDKQSITQKIILQ